MVYVIFNSKATESEKVLLLDIVETFSHLMVDRTRAKDRCLGTELCATPSLFHPVRCPVSHTEVSWAQTKELLVCGLVLAITSNC